MPDLTTPQDLARELGLHPKTIRSRLRDYFSGRHEHHSRWELDSAEVDEFPAWHATRYGATG